MRRRDVISALPAAALTGTAAQAAAFGEADVQAQAKALAARPYRPPVTTLPAALDGLDYDAYRDIRFRPQRSYWGELGLPFQLQMFHRGGLFRTPVDLFEVVGGVARPIAYDSSAFTFGRTAPGRLPSDLGFAGFRIHAPINVAGRFDEVAAFLGASYFRAVGRGDVYGLSARGLALGSGESGEEFPEFRRFYIERPAAGATTLVLHALLDSASVAGAYRFVIAPGAPTRMEVSATLFPRRVLSGAGIAPLTSMFLFGPEQPRRFDDFRPEVHDSDGLAVAMPDGRRLWRPLVNPQAARTSVMPASGVRGFGLLQRERSWPAYQDLEADYHLRPSAWVEPLEGFNDGAVDLVELPARSEAEDNIVSFWRPKTPLPIGQGARFRYRLSWGREAAPGSAVASVAAWRTGQGDGAGRRRFVVDFAPLSVSDLPTAQPEVKASIGSVHHLVVEPNEHARGARVSFQFDPAGGSEADISAALVRGGRPVSETWTYRWAA